MISQKLLSEVLFDGRVKIKGLGVNGNILDYSLFCNLNQLHDTDHNKDIPDNHYVVEMNRYDDINLHELAHKCKEWAYKKGFSVDSRYWNDVLSSVELFDVLWSPPKGSMYICDADTEVEAIFKACQWIMEQR